MAEVWALYIDDTSYDTGDNTLIGIFSTPELAVRAGDEIAAEFPHARAWSAAGWSRFLGKRPGDRTWSTLDVSRFTLDHNYWKDNP